MTSCHGKVPALFRPNLHRQTVSEMSTDKCRLTNVLLLLDSSTSSEMNLKEIMPSQLIPFAVKLTNESGSTTKREGVKNDGFYPSLHLLPSKSRI